MAQNVNELSETAALKPGDAVKNLARIDERKNYPRAKKWPRGVTRGFRHGTDGVAGKLDSAEEKVNSENFRVKKCQLR